MALANLLIKIGADISELQVNSDKAVRGIERTSQKIDTIGSSIKSTLLGAFSITAIAGFGQELLRMGDDIVRTADQTGLLTDEVQRLSYIAGQSGNSIEQITGSIGQMQNRLASGDKSALGALKALGVSFDDLRTKSPYEQLSTIAEAIGEIPNPAIRAQIAMDVFGRSGIALLPTLTANFKELGDAAPVMGDNTVRALDAAGDAFDGFTLQIKVWAAESYNFFGRVMDAQIAGLYRLIAGMNDAVGAVTKLAMKIPGASKVFGDLDANLAAVTENARWYRDAAKGLEGATTKAGEAAKGAARDFKGLAAPIVELTDAQKKAKSAAEAHAKAIASMRDELSGRGALTAAKDMVVALKGISAAQIEASGNTERVNQTLGRALDVYKETGVVAPAAIRQIYQETIKFTTDAIPRINRFKDDLQKLTPEALIPFVNVSKRAWPATIEGLDGIIFRLPLVGRMIKDTTRTITQDLFGALQQIPQLVVSAFTGGGGIAGAVKAVASSVGAAVGGSIGMAVGGPMGAAIGSALGSLAGPLVGKIGKLLGIGATEYEKRMRAAATETRNLQQQLIASHGSMAQLIIDADLVGINIKEAFNWKDPEAFKTVVTDLEAKTTLLTAAMEEYGFTWEDLGDKARNAKLGQLFDELFAKTDVLRVAGIDYDEILRRQAKDYSALVQAAIRTGTEIPIAMQPVLQDLIDMGQLVDENGVAFTDLSKVTWAQTLTQGFAQVTTAIYELRDALTKGVGGALDDLGRRTVRIPIKFDVDDPPGGREVQGFAGGTHGRFLNFGSGTMVELHGRERVMTEHESLGVDGGTVNVFIGNEQLDSRVVKVTRTDAARGGLKPRASSGRSY